MSSRNYKLLVFDWDGTLMDSEARIVTCLRASLEDLGLVPLDDRTLKNVIGLGLPEAVRTLIPDADQTMVRDFTDRYRSHFLSSRHDNATLFDGALETIRHLHAAGYLLAIATGKGRLGLDRSLDEVGCREYFHLTRCADETFSKPHPRMLQEIMAVLDIPAEETLMIGDTEYDLQMARNAGTTALAVSYGVHERDRLLSFEPLACIDEITEVIEWLADKQRTGSVGQS